MANTDMVTNNDDANINVDQQLSSQPRSKGSLYLEKEPEVERGSWERGCPVQHPSDLMMSCGTLPFDSSYSLSIRLFFLGVSRGVGEGSNRQRKA